MTIRMTSVQSRALALGLLVLTIGLIVAAIAMPTWWLHKRYDTYLEDSVDRLMRYRRVAALRPAVEEAIAETEKRDGHRYYLKGASPTLAAAELQGMVTKVIENHKGRIISSQVLPPKDDGKAAGPAKVAISVQLNAAIIPLQLILHTIEVNEPSLFIEQLTVRAGQGRGYKSVPGIQPEYAVQMTIYGYTPAPGAKP